MKWHWDRLYSEYFGTFPVCIIPPMLHTHLHLRAILTRRTKEETWELSKSNALLEIREHWIEKYIQFNSLEGLRDIGFQDK
jgi:hypothetical protein